MQAARATRFLASTEPLELADLIVAEVVYVLESVSEVARGDVSRLTRSIVASDRMRVADLPLLLRTLEVYERHRLAFADAYLVASDERSGRRVGGLVRSGNLQGGHGHEDPAMSQMRRQPLPCSWVGWRIARLGP